MKILRKLRGVPLFRLKSEKIRPDLQGLRALAVMAVLIYHISPEMMSGGFAGVDMFFVLSGFLMTASIVKMILRREKDDRGRVKGFANVKMMVEFYARRIRRLLPASLTVLFVVLGVVFVSGLYSLQIKTAEQVQSSALFYQNWQLADQATDYFGSSETPTAVQHFWSLSLEEQFYALWPLALLIIFTISVFVLSRRWKCTKKLFKRIPQAVPLFVTGLLAFVLFIYGFFLTRGNASVAYFSTPARMWELLAGGVLVFIPALKDKELKLILPWLGIALCVYSCISFTGGDAWPGWRALIPVVGSMMVIYGGSDGKWSVNNLSRLRPIQWVGDISYSLYLWHWPLIILLPVFTEQAIVGVKWKVVVFVGSFILAWLSYRFIETPSRGRKRREG